SGLLGVFRGYFQAHKITLYTSISQIIEQIFNAIVALAAAYIFIQPYVGVNATKVGSYGAAGSALGTGVGVLIGLIYMVFMYLKKKNTFEEEQYINDNYDENVNTYKEIFQMIIHIITPIILATCVYNLVTTVDMYIFYFTQSFQGVDKIAYYTYYGVYSGKYIVLQNVPVALASAMSTASIPSISSAWAVGNKRETKEHITSGISVTMLILIPAMVGMTVLAYPIMGILFPQKDTIMMATYLLMLGSPAIVLFGLSTLTNGILQAIGEVHIPLKNATKALVIHSIVLVVLLLITPFGTYLLAFGNCLYAFLVCYFNQIELRKKIGYKQEIKRTYLIPLIASVIMGIIVGFVYYGLFTLMHRVFISLMISIVVGVIVYFILIIYIYWDHPQELYSIPYMRTIYAKLKRRFH
ncbi:MAG: polysaccharide biosynthesis C-terminal domain-containing protein, partial [Faecalibacillus sp.]